jgi:hypothetical protein
MRLGDQRRIVIKFVKRANLWKFVIILNTPDRLDAGSNDATCSDATTGE